MVVKSMAVLLIMIALVAGIAVSASRAGPALGTHTAVARCLAWGPTATSYLCQPMVRVLNERIDGDYLGENVGGDNINPEAKVARFLHFIAVVAEAAAQLLDNLTYGPQVDTAAALVWVDELFDTSLH